MNYKYLMTLGKDIFWGKQEITTEQLIMVKDGRYDTLINLEEMTRFNAEENKWEKIPGDGNPH